MNAPAIRYGRLTLIEADVGRSADGHILSHWLCDCGTVTEVARSRVKSGATQSCGCLAREVSLATATKHGGRKTREYSSWIAMKRRCESEGDKDYPRYDGRGITICPEWSASFSAFLADMGPRPTGTTLDRIDASRGYEPGNVRWATAKVQGRNRRGAHIWHIDGQTFGSVTEAAKAFGVSEQTVWRWAHGSYDKRRDQTIPPRPNCHAEPRYT